MCVCVCVCVFFFFFFFKECSPTNSEFYMSHIENKIFKTTIAKPKVYICYVDIFMAIHTYNKINKPKQTLKKKNSVLNFTTKLNINKKNPFLWCSYKLH